MMADLFESLLTDNNWALFVFLLLLLAVTYLVMRITGRRFTDLKRQTEEWKVELSEKTARLGAQVGTRATAADLNKIFVDLHEFTREVEGRLDTKISRLRELLEEVESAERRLDDKLERIGDRGDDPELSEGSASIRERKRVTKETVGTNVDVIVGGGKTRALAADIVSVDQVAPTTDASFDRVVGLYESGNSVAQIVDSTRLPKGEIELMLNLYETQRGGAK